jgi:hypothetical protein
MRRGYAEGAAFLVALAASACTVELSRSESADIVKNQCTSDADCRGGSCFTGGVCVANQGTLSSLLFEITPPATSPIPGIGGARFLKMQHELSLSSEQHLLNMDVSATVHGYFSSPCQFEATLTPEEQSYGLPGVNYVARTSPAEPGTCRPKGNTSGTQELVVNVPPGKYGVYLRPSSSAVATGDAGVVTCDAVPVALGPLEAKPGISCVTLAIPATQTLDVQIPWAATSPSLAGWNVDIVHPITGQALSRRNKLEGELQPLANGTGYRLDVEYSPAVAVGAMNAKQEVLRLSPPAPGDGPVVQLSLLALVNSSPVGSSAAQKGPQKAILPSNMGPFPNKVHLVGGVFDAQSLPKENPVPSTLTFTATKLDGLPDGVPATFVTTLMVGDDGKIAVDLLPGVYRVRVVPAVNPDSEVRWAAQETIWIVRESDGALQAGRTIDVLRAATVIGQAGSGMGGWLAGAGVQMLPGSVGMRRCSDRDASTCASQPISALDVALAEGAFIPRSAAAVTRHDGAFTVRDVDCGDCSAQRGANALFDVTVRPADGSRLPWIVHPGVVVSESSERDLGGLQTTLPIVQRGTVQVLQENTDHPTMAAKPIPLPGTLISAYLLRDASGAPIFDPTGLPSCATGTYSGSDTGGRCIRSALKVAQTFAAAEGKYELVLPAAIDAAAP